MGEAVMTSEDAATNQRVLIIDDEQAICGELEKLFQSLGYQTSSIVTPEELSSALKWNPDLILLDIWMPGKDGLVVLEEIIAAEPELPVIMMSGHATIATAVQATQMGASDFLEKPLDLDLLVEKVGNALKSSAEKLRDIHSEAPSTHATVDSSVSEVQKIAPRKDLFGTQKWAGSLRVQKTLQHATILYGQGLHSGKKSGITLEPLPANSGIHFVGVASEQAVAAHVDRVESTGFATSLRRGAMTVQTIEHLLSALHAYGISNLLVKCNEEVPVLDGSAIEFCNTIEEVGIVEQPGDWYALRVMEDITFDTGKEQIVISPSDRFEIDYELRYPEPLGVQKFSFVLDDVESYKKEIATARTFGFVQDVGYLQAQGLAQGGRMDNFVLYGKDGAINQDLRFENEAVRHKILDAIGDLFLLGRPLEGKITAVMTGHSDNINLLKEIQKHIS